MTSRKAPADANPSYSYVQGDLSQPESVESIFSQVRKLHGEPTVIVYNGMYILIFLFDGGADNSLVQLPVSPWPQAITLSRWTWPLSKNT